MTLQQAVSTEVSNLQSDTPVLPSYTPIQTEVLDLSPSTQSSVEMVLSQHENYIYNEYSGFDEIHNRTIEVPIQVEEDRFPWLKVKQRNECNEAYSSFSKYMNDAIVTVYEDIKREQEFFILADNYVNVTSELSLVKYRECFDLIEEGKVIIDVFWLFLIRLPK